MIVNSELEEIFKCRQSFAYFSKTYIQVLHPERGLVPFSLFPFQENKVLPTFERESRVILKKFRQAGLSTLAAMYSLWKILFFTDQRVLMISMTDRDSKNLMSMIKKAWDNLPSWMICQTLEFSQHVLKIETGSEIRCGTPKMGRGYSANIIVIDEAAFIPNMEEVWKGIFPTLSAAGSSARVFVISTVNGLGNWYADTYHDAKDHKNNFYCLDLEYTEHPEYNNEKYIKNMKEELGPRGWDQEVLGIFLSASDTFIKPEIIRKLKEITEEEVLEPKKLYKDKLWIWKNPKPGRSYILSADVAEGLGGEHDYSAFHVLDMATMEQVAEFCDNTVSTYEYTKIINEIGNRYNGAVIVVENNSLGNGVLQRLYQELEYENLYWHREGKKSTKLGFTMSTRTRPLVMNTFSNLVENNHVKIKSQRLVHEIQTFEFNAKTGKAQARRGRHDDLILAMSIGLFIRNNVLNNLPFGSEDEYEVDDDDFEPTFNPAYTGIFKSSDIDDKQKNKDDDSAEGIDIINYVYPSDDEEILRDFGWISDQTIDTSNSDY